MKKLLTILILLCSLSSFGQFGMFQSHNRAYSQPIKYGDLYNWYAATDARNISSIGWILPSIADWVELREYLDPGSTDTSNDAGQILKTEGTDFWLVAGGTNTVNFNGVGGGTRFSGGAFFLLKETAHFHVSNDPDVSGTNSNRIRMFDDNAVLQTTSTALSDGKLFGYTVRLVRDATVDEQLLPDGTYVDNYIGNDLRSYKAVKIGNQIWLAENLAETKYRNGDLIPEVTDNTVWSGLTTGARCVYGNDENNR